MAFFQPARARRGLPDAARPCRAKLHRPDARDLHVEQPLDRLADLDLVGVRWPPRTCTRRASIARGRRCDLLGDQRPDDLPLSATAYASASPPSRRRATSWRSRPGVASGLSRPSRCTRSSAGASRRSRASRATGRRRRLFAERQHLHVRQVTRRQVHVRLGAVGQDQHLLPVEPDASRAAPASCFVFGASARSARSRTDVAVPRARVERAAPGSALHLPRHILVVARAGCGPKTTPPPRQCGARIEPCGRGRCPSGATASGCRRRHAARLGRGRALALVGQVAFTAW